MNVVKGTSGDVCGVLSAFSEAFLSIATSAAARSFVHMMTDFGQDRIRKSPMHRSQPRAKSCNQSKAGENSRSHPSAGGPEVISWPSVIQWVPHPFAYFAKGWFIIPEFQSLNSRDRCSHPCKERKDGHPQSFLRQKRAGHPPARAPWCSYSLPLGYTPLISTRFYIP